MAAQLIARNGLSARWRVLVDGAGDQFLAGAALAEDEHRHVLPRRPGRSALYTSCIAGQRPSRTSPAVGAGPTSGMVAGVRISRLDCTARSISSPQVGQLERLEQVLVRPLLHRLDGEVGGAVPGDEDDRDAGVDRADAVERLESRLRRAGGRRARPRPAGRASTSASPSAAVVAVRTVTPSAERALEGVPDGRFVVDHQQRRHSRPSPSDHVVGTHREDPSPGRRLASLTSRRVARRTGHPLPVKHGARGCLLLFRRATRAVSQQKQADTYPLAPCFTGRGWPARTAIERRSGRHEPPAG